MVPKFTACLHTDETTSRLLKILTQRLLCTRIAKSGMQQKIAFPSTNDPLTLNYVSFVMAAFKSLTSRSSFPTPSLHQTPLTSSPSRHQYSSPISTRVNVYCRDSITTFRTFLPNTPVHRTSLSFTHRGPSADTKRF
jgi:hypothetical protein